MRVVSDDGLVAIIKEEFPGLRVRMLSDRDAGQIVWESTFLDGSGEPRVTVTRTFKPVELHAFEDLIDMLESAVDLLTPVSRPDRARVRPPGPSS